MNFSKLFMSDFAKRLAYPDSQEIIEGRTVLRDVRAPIAIVESTIPFKTWNFDIKSGKEIIKRQTFVDLHFIGCHFLEVGFFGVHFKNCIFEKCQCQSMGFWKSRIEDCNFIESNLRDAAMGGQDMFSNKFKPNCYTNVTFDQCDMRGSAHSSENYSGCLFKNCRLDGVQFMGAVLVDCKFVGKLEEVEFREFDLSPEQIPINRLAGCDFREAELIDCQFIGIGLDLTMFPENEDWIALPNGQADLLRWKAMTGINNLYVDHIISIAGAPTFANRSDLLEVRIPPEQIALLEDIAAGRI